MGRQFIMTSSQSNNLLVNQLIASSNEVTTDLPFDVKYLAQSHSIDLHTKKRYQSYYDWNDCVGAIVEQMSLYDADNDHQQKFLVEEPMNLAFAQDAFVNSLMIMPVFKNRVWMDTIKELMQDFDLTPVSRNINFKKFDKHINKKLPDDMIVYFKSDDPLVDIASGLKNYRKSQKTLQELVDIIDGLPFYVLENAFRHTDHDVDKVLDELFPSFMEHTKSNVETYVEKTKEKLFKFDDNNLVVIVDIYALLYSDEETGSIAEYDKLTKRLKITPNYDELRRHRRSLHRGRQRCLGTKDIPQRWYNVFEVIGNTLLNVTGIKMDTQLEDIKWHAGCQLALSHALPDLKLNYKGAEIIGDLLPRG